MQVLILAGGFGTRFSEETELVPKPMIKIGGIPMLVHIMNYYKFYGHQDFIIAGGYKVDVIFDYFKDVETHYNISVYDTGLNTGTAGRIKKLQNVLEENFLLTYGDGLGDIDIEKSIKFHQKSNNMLTMTAVKPPPRFGSLEIIDDQVTKFDEKNPLQTGWINGGFFYCTKNVLKYINNFDEPFEGEPIKKLVSINKVGAFKHNGWWHPMDTLRDKKILEYLWDNDLAPWKKNG